MKSEKIKNILRVIRRIFGLAMFALFTSMFIDEINKKPVEWGFAVFWGIMALIGIYLIIISIKKKPKPVKEPEIQKTKIVKCKACGAETEIKEGEVKVCEYCGKPLTDEAK